MIDDSKAINKMLWTSKIEDIDDVQLFFCHLYLDLDVVIIPYLSFEDYVHEKTRINKFSKKAAKQYDVLMKKCRFICDTVYHDYIYVIAEKIYTESVKWINKDNNDPIIKIVVHELSAPADESKYQAQTKSLCPFVSIFYSLRGSECKKLGYGVLCYHEETCNGNNGVDGDGYAYKIYDHERKIYIKCVLLEIDHGNVIYLLSGTE